MSFGFPSVTLALLSLFTSATSSPHPSAMRSIGPISFGPQNTLFVADPMAATLYAVDVSEYIGDGFEGDVFVNELDVQLADVLGAEAGDIRIIDMAVHPTSRQVFFSIMRGQGPDAMPVVLYMGAGGDVDEVALEGDGVTKVTLPNPPHEDSSRRSQRGGGRAATITDLAFVGGRVLVAGLSNEEFSSKLRAVPFPFTGQTEGVSVEIYHGAHGMFETHAPVRTFIPFNVDNKPHLLAAYTCTPLVKFPIEDLVPGNKVRGTTIAELGAGNAPLDMIAYEKGGVPFLLISNSRRGVMKVATDEVATVEVSTPVVGETAGVKYETVDNLDGVEQLDRYDENHALFLIRDAAGTLKLKSLAFP